MTAKPLYDIMRAIIAEIVNNPNDSHHDKRADFKSLLGCMEGEYSYLQNKRNELLHGTWQIGYISFDDPDAREFHIRKYKTSADGLKAAEGLPKNASELISLGGRCDALRNWIGHVDFCLRDRAALDDFFRRENQTWFFRLSDSTEWTTLPKR
jgi:hypothetical protein